VNFYPDPDNCDEVLKLDIEFEMIHKKAIEDSISVNAKRLENAKGDKELVNKIVMKLLQFFNL
jgi:inosine-uridine nucleoside N-ribohydrolase